MSWFCTSRVANCASVTVSPRNTNELISPGFADTVYCRAYCACCRQHGGTVPVHNQACLRVPGIIGGARIDGGRGPIPGAVGGAHALADDSDQIEDGRGSCRGLNIGGVNRPLVGVDRCLESAEAARRDWRRRQDFGHGLGAGPIHPRRTRIPIASAAAPARGHTRRPIPAWSTKID